jgi:hypothetical protein
MLTYFLQVNLCWLLFYGLYYALLSRETFFKLNRIYLIISLLCGLVIPLSIMSVTIKPDHPAVVMLQPFVVTATTLEQNIQEVERIWSIWTILKIHYWLGVGILGMRFLSGLFKIKAIYNNAHIIESKGFKVAYTEGATTPFSFFNTVFVNPNQFDSIDFQHIMQHEKAHITQKHTYDILFLEIATIFFWCSPLIYFYKKSLVNVHEYLADEAVLKTVSTPQYGRLLLQQIQIGSQPALVNPFFSQLKKRINMMTRNPSHRSALLRYVIAVPLFMVLVLAFALPNSPAAVKANALTNNVSTTVDALDDKLNNLIDKNNNIQGVENQYFNNELLNNNDVIKDDIVPCIDGFVGGKITVERMKKSKRLYLINLRKKQEVPCVDLSFSLVYVPRREDPIQVNYNSELEEVFHKEYTKIKEKLKEGDSFNFMNISGTLPGDTKKTNIGSISIFVQDNIQHKVLKDTIAPPKSNIERLKNFPPENIKKMNVTDDGHTITLEMKDGTIEKLTLTDEEKEQMRKEGKINAEQAKVSAVFKDVDELPEFIGGNKKLFEWLGQNVKYPVKARENGFEGTVFVGFVVEVDGSLSDIKVKREPKQIFRDTITLIEINGIKGNKIVENEVFWLGNEALRVIKLMPKWKPGKQNGVPVRTSYTLPIKFKLE